MIYDLQTICDRYITFLVMNLSTWLRRVFCVFLCHKPKITPIYGLMIIKSYNWESYS